MRHTIKEAECDVVISVYFFLIPVLTYLPKIFKTKASSVQFSSASSEDHHLKCKYELKEFSKNKVALNCLFYS